MKSTITGDSGRVYTKGKLLRRSPYDNKFDIHQAESSGRGYTYKHVSKPYFDLAGRIASDFVSAPTLRMHVDCVKQDTILIHPFFRDTLLALLQNDPAFPAEERFKVMQDVTGAIQELHTKDWIHGDVKPDNILIDWESDAESNKTITTVALGDFDISCQLKDGETRITPHAMGNAMWRSPEGQTGISSKASDIYSLGLVYLYILGMGELLTLDDYQSLVKAGITAEQEVISRHFSYFGPVPESLYHQVEDEAWRTALRLASKAAEAAVEDNPMLRLKAWSIDLGETAVDLLAGMTNLDPKARLTIDQVLVHPFWREAAS